MVVDIRVPPSLVPRLPESLCASPHVANIIIYVADVSCARAWPAQSDGYGFVIPGVYILCLRTECEDSSLRTCESSRDTSYPIIHL